jgi:ribonuclease HII
MSPRRQKKTKPSFKFERELKLQGHLVVAGVDEAGRGAWAGPVVAAAVVLPFLNRSYGINDSKLLTPLQREKLLLKVYALATDIGIGVVENQELDEMGVGQATYLAMRRAVANLSLKPEFILVDGFRVGFSGAPSMGIIDGDQKSLSIAAASIVAKVARDRMMEEIDEVSPGYGWAVNKGYGTVVHQVKLLELGVSDWHRKSFRPVKEAISNTANLRM